MSRIAAFLVFISLLTFTAVADDKEHHHEDLTEAQLGTVHFPVSCAQSVQKPFARGVALLHSFWYEEAEKGFIQIAKDDPHCAMAHWGVAMSIWHQLWNEPDAKVIARGLEESNTASKLAENHCPREGLHRRHHSFLQRLGEVRSRSPCQSLLRWDEEGVRSQSQRSRSRGLLRPVITGLRAAP